MQHIEKTRLYWKKMAIRPATIITITKTQWKPKKEIRSRLTFFLQEKCIIVVVLQLRNEILLRQVLQRNLVFQDIYFPIVCKKRSKEQPVS